MSSHSDSVVCSLVVTVPRVHVTSQLALHMPNRFKSKEEEADHKVSIGFSGTRCCCSDSDHQRRGVLTDNVRNHSNNSESKILDGYKTKISRQTASLIILCIVESSVCAHVHRDTCKLPYTAHVELMMMTESSHMQGCDANPSSVQGIVTRRDHGHTRLRRIRGSCGSSESRSTTSSRGKGQPAPTVVFNSRDLSRH